MSTADVKALSSAPPPWHSVFFIGLALAISSLVALSNGDENVSVDVFTHRVLPKLVSLEGMAYLRLFLAASVWMVSFHLVVISNGWEQTTTYRKDSKLVKVANHMVGWKTMCPFTSLSWNLLGLNFTLSGYIAWSVANGESDFSPQFLKFALVIWEVSAPFSVLVSMVIRYVIWPGVLKAKGDTSNLRSTSNKFMHNFNCVYSLAEASLIGGLPVRWQDLPYATIVGCFYVIFTWLMALSWNEKKYGPQFIYFFLDTTLPGFFPSFALIALLVALCIFYAFFATLSNFILPQLEPYGLPAHAFIVAIFASRMVRFKD